jgi:hypothetical protein
MDNNLKVGSLVLVKIHDENPWVALLINKENYLKETPIWSIVDVENDLRQTQIWEKEIIKLL